MGSVRTQFNRILFSLGVLIALSIWQWGFVLNAVSSNPALNGLIFGTFFFGFYLVFSGAMTIRNEYRSFNALQEMLADVRGEQQTRELDPYWRYRRCNDIGIVFKRPNILGQAYQLISDRLRQEKDLSITASTMQTLVDGIDERVQEIRSLISYVAGILVLLGLIGTFLGLMITLASVGDILGSLDLTGGDPTETVSGLMESLQVPLGGMATGFSSSLFGLVTSLALSLQQQLLSRAFSTLKSDFSNWLSDAVELHEGEVGLSGYGGVAVSTGDGSNEGGAVHHAPQVTLMMEERRLALLMKTARHILVANRHQGRSLRQVTKGLEALALETAEVTGAMREATDRLQALSDQNEVVHKAIARSTEALAAVAQAQTERKEIAELTALLSTRFQERDARVLTGMRQIYRRVGEIAADRAREQDAQDTEHERLQEALGEEITDLNINELRNAAEEMRLPPKAARRATSAEGDPRPAAQAKGR
ncbi:MAG: hypothetical protein AAF850_00045 [Pseudomonadota bacterium]